jgi:hypothetical protein
MPTFVNGAKASANNLTLLASNALDLAAAGSVLNVESSELVDWVQIAAKAIAGLFTAGLTDGVAISLGDDEPISYPGPADESLLNASRWIQGFALASISRDYNALDALCGIRVEQLRNSSTKSPEYVYHMVEAFQAFWDRSPKTDKLILKAMELTDPNKYEFHNPDYVLDLSVPLLELLFYVNRRDPDFERGLIKGLRRHQVYWTRTLEQQRNWDGFLAFGLLGMASLADVRDMEFEVESDYLPMSLIR